MNRHPQGHCDFLVIGTGLAGVSFALKASQFGHVILVSKKSLEDTNTAWAQGGIASVMSDDDSFHEHVDDSLQAGAGLCREDIVRMVITQGPDRIKDLVNWGVRFDQTNGRHDLTKEGGHTKRRIHHVQDHTGRSVHQTLLQRVREQKNITILEDYFAIDLITNRKIDPRSVEAAKCYGAYVLNQKTHEVSVIKARATVLATGGAGKVYLYTSNWEGATGDGIAMAHRAGCRVSNMEFMQFHPTCLYHPSARNFLITEAIRGEGGRLLNKQGEAFMQNAHPQAELAPRDIVARSIDAEIKRSGAESVFLDISFKPREFILSHFPVIYERCLEYGIDITKQPIPVVPAAHYLCGGVSTDQWGHTDLHGLFVIGESSNTGLHGANRLASNSLLECLVFAHNAAQWIQKNLDQLPLLRNDPPAWVYTENQNDDELVMINHMWDEIRRLMWNYVGIVRTDKRLHRAQHRLKNILAEIQEYYWDFKLHPDILELRNIALVADLTVTCALQRKESRGIHYNLDYPQRLPDSEARDTWA